MKRDPDVVRAILLNLEAKATPYPGHLKVEGTPDDVVSYHVQLLIEAGLVEGINASTLAGADWWPARMTYAGHELLDSVRDEKIWHQTKEVAKKAGTASLKALFDIAVNLGKQKLTEFGVHL